ncbi:BamA/TamA family outer membrane protein [Elusimicrobiota bacterium]
MLANHALDLYGWAWPGLYEGSIQYTFKKWRPDIIIGASTVGEKYKISNDDESLDTIKEYTYSGMLGYQYPLNSFVSFTNWVQAESRDENNTTVEEKTHETETGVGISISRNTALLEPFHVFRGSLLTLTAYFVKPVERSGIEYNQYEMSAKKYLPFGHRLTWANRLFLARREGEDAEEFYLDYERSYFINPSFRLRGYGRKTFEGKDMVSYSSELRWMVFPDIGWHIYFMFPDINIYSMSLNLFSDWGTCWNDDNPPEYVEQWGRSWGMGLKLNLYIMQLAPVYTSVEFARPIYNDKWKVYWVFSSGYVTW